MSPLTRKGRKIMESMKDTYKDKGKAEEVFYASRNSGKIDGVEKRKGKYRKHT